MYENIVIKQHDPRVERIIRTRQPDVYDPQALAYPKPKREPKRKRAHTQTPIDNPHTPPASI